MYLHYLACVHSCRSVCTGYISYTGPPLPYLHRNCFRRPLRPHVLSDLSAIHHYHCGGVWGSLQESFPTITSQIYWGSSTLMYPWPQGVLIAEPPLDCLYILWHLRTLKTGENGNCKAVALCSYLCTCTGMCLVS